jgi:hypothetical protein
MPPMSRVQLALTSLAAVAGGAVVVIPGSWDRRVVCGYGSASTVAGGPGPAGRRQPASCGPAPIGHWVAMAVSTSRRAAGRAGSEPASSPATAAAHGDQPEDSRHRSRPRPPARPSYLSVPGHGLLILGRPS